MSEIACRVLKYLPWKHGLKRRSLLRGRTEFKWLDIQEKEEIGSGSFGIYTQWTRDRKFKKQLHEIWQIFVNIESEMRAAECVCVYSEMQNSYVVADKKPGNKRRILWIYLADNVFNLYAENTKEIGIEEKGNYTAVLLFDRMPGFFLRGKIILAWSDLQTFTS